MKKIMMLVGIISLASASTIRETLAAQGSPDNNNPQDQWMKPFAPPQIDDPQPNRPNTNPDIKKGANIEEGVNKRYERDTIKQDTKQIEDQKESKVNPVKDDQYYIVRKAEPEANNDSRQKDNKNENQKAKDNSIIREGKLDEPQKRDDRTS